MRAPGFYFRALLFLIYINDIINFSNILSFVLCSDGTTEYVQHDLIDGGIQILSSYLAKVEELLDSNKMTRNVNKTQMLMISWKKNLNPQDDIILQTYMKQYKE